MKALSILFILCLFFAGGVDASEWKSEVLANVTEADAANCASYPKVSNLDEQFLCESLLIKVTNSLYKSWLSDGDKGIKMQAIDQWWDTKGGSSLRSPLVRLHLAALIGQGRKNDIMEHREYTLKYLLSENELIKGAAITALGWVGNCDDVKAIKLIIKDEQEGIAEKAVLALLKLVGPYKSEKVLHELTGDLHRESLKRFIKKQLSTFG